MNKLIDELKKVRNLSEIENIDSIDNNDLFYAIAKSERYDLLNGSNLRLNINNIVTLEKFIDYLYLDENVLYYLHQNEFSFSKEEHDSILNIIFQKHQYSYELDYFFTEFFTSKEQLNQFIKEHEQFFENYIDAKKIGVSLTLKDCDHFVELILKNNHLDLVSNLEKYSLSNLKLLIPLLKQQKDIPYYFGNKKYAEHLFEFKFDLEPNEFIELLNLLKDKSTYDKKEKNSQETSFSTLVRDNIDYLIDVVTQTKIIPKCLMESSVFRDECIKRNRIDLAVSCLLSSDILQNEELVNAYCKELCIEPKDFYERSKWLLNYYEKNNNIFNTFLATSLKDNIFNLNKEHFERFINDVEVQISISKLNDKEIEFLSKVLNDYNYKEYDITSMIVNVINNISNYQELIKSIDVENISKQDLKSLISVLQLPDNQYQINDLNRLHRYAEIKKEFFERGYSENDLSLNKDNLFKLLFNIDLEEAQYIDSKYCHDNDDSNMLDRLKNSELPPSIYNYLSLINKIIECEDPNYLSILYNSLKDTNFYDSEIPFESFLRSKYTELYSQSLYKIDERNKIYGPKDSISDEINFNGTKIQVSIPRANFNFFVHCLGSCSLKTDVTDNNYKNDWLYRPQLKDHFVACSYINEKGIYSIVTENTIILGFDSLEGGSILGMGKGDIDSICKYANDYDGSRGLQKYNGSRARFFVPSEIIDNTNHKYNEIVVERRNLDQSKCEEFKRKPDYIIMMAESMEQDNFNYLENLYQNQLSFISDDDKKEIKEIDDSKKLKQFLVKYKEIISQNAINEGITTNNMANNYVNLIMKAKYFEDCLKASSEFNIPLVIVDRKYYFNKLLTESSVYDNETLTRISEVYSNGNVWQKKKMFDMVAKGADVSQIIKPKESNSFKVGL